MNMPALNGTDQRLLELLGTGSCSAVQAAAALGISEARVSQFLSDENNALLVAEQRFKNLQAHTVRDNKYDELEDTVLEKLKNSLELVFQPMQLMKILQVLNSAKRRGASSPEQLVNNQTVVQLTMPVVVKKKVVVNIQNNVVAIGTIGVASNNPQEDTERSIQTISSTNLDKLKEKRANDYGNKALEGIYREACAGKEKAITG